MNKYNTVGLYDHNASSYEKIKQGFLEDDVVSIVHATGTGKSYNALQLAYDNKDKKITYIVPSNSIIEHLNEIIKENPNLDLKRDFPNLEFITYQSLVNMSEEEIEELDIDLLILDEFHHIGAPVWGSRIDTIVETHEDMQILGMTAYTVRDRGTSYERDMANPETDELFSNTVVSNYDLCDAMIDGVLPKPIYKSGYVYLEKTINAIEERLEKENKETKLYKELSVLLKDVKKRVHEAPSVKDIFKTNIKPDGKYIYFCPPITEDGRNDINSIMAEVRSWIKEMGLSEDDYEFYVTTSKMGEDGKKNRDAFYKDVDLNGNKTNKKLRIMFAINQYNEGVHAPGLDGVIMGRGTSSDIVFFEQLGRGLAVRERTKEEYDKLYSKPIEELIGLCKERQIKITDINSKEEIIEQLLAPVIIDLANNIGFIKELENNLTDRVKEIQEKRNGTKRKVHLGNTSFDIDMINEDLFEILRYMYDRLTLTWMDKFNLAKAYYEHHGNLEIPRNFKTTNGYEYDENGIALGTWINKQRLAYNGKGLSKISSEQIKLLESIVMIWNVYDEEWMDKYNLAKEYYKRHGNLEVPRSFKTINGYEYDEKGIALGSWIVRQRYAYKRNEKISPNQIKLLESIGMQWNVYDKKWMDKFNLAKVYYEHHGNLEVPRSFKTINGIDYDENGIALGSWIINQRYVYNGKENNKITPSQIKLLESIGMQWNVYDKKWMEKYNLAKEYYKHHGNLEISSIFKTINGYEYDENGIALGVWIQSQRVSYNGKSKRKIITPVQIKLLENIGMIWSIHDKEWMDKFKLVENYYNYFGDLNIPQNFKTINGYEYDKNGVNLGSWIDIQRQAYNGKNNLKIMPKQIKMLESIGMKWYLSEKKDYKNQNEMIDEKTSISKQIEITNRVHSYLNKQDGNSLLSKKEINQGLLDELNFNYKKK